MGKKQTLKSADPVVPPVDLRHANQLDYTMEEFFGQGRTVLVYNSQAINFMRRKSARPVKEGPEGKTDSVKYTVEFNAPYDGVCLIAKVV